MANNDNLLRDSFSLCIAGMNSDPAPILLEKNQAAMATNVTFRGGFIRNRPPIRRMALDFNGDPILQTRVERSLFQGAGYYKPDYGAEQLMAHIAGRSFTFTPDATTNVAISDVTIPGDPNSAISLQAWGWQAELFWIWMDGENLPTFYDGTVTRRSFGPERVLAVTAAPFAIPAIGSTVQVTLTAVYTGEYNIPVLVLGSQYTLLQYTAGTANARLTRRSNDPAIPAGTVIAIGSPVLVIPSRVGSLTSVLGNLAQGFPGSCPGGARSAFVNISYPANNTGVGISGLAGPSSAFGSSPGSGPTVTISNGVQSDQFKILAIAPNSESQPGYTIQVQTLAGSGGAGVCFTVSHNVGEIVTLQSSAPNVPVGTLAATFVQPAMGGSVDVELDTAYTGGNQIVWIGNDQYIIEQLPVPPSNVVTLLNVNATPPGPVASPENILSLPELPAGRMGAYGLGRNAVSLLDGRSFMLGDIVGGSSGTVTYQNRDAVLRSTENTFLAGGGNFVVPGTVGNIRSMTFAATLDVSLGQGPLQVGTPTIMFSCQAPVDRTIWQSITNPILTESLKGQGPLSQNATINLNSDIGFRSPLGWASLVLARREFDTWGNVGQSTEVQRIIDLDNASLLQYSSSVDFDNRMLLTCFPTQGPLGVYHQGLIAMNLDPISSLRGKAASIYDGLWTGLNVLQLVTGLFAGVQRAFAFCYNLFESKIELYELLATKDSNIYDNDSNPISMSFETPVFFKPENLNRAPYLRLEDGEITVDKVYGVVTFQVWYRSEFDSCWHPWITWSVCSGNDSAIPQWRPRMGFGKPPSGTANCDPVTNRPFCEGKFFQLRIQVTGACEVKNIGLAASEQPLPQFSPPICKQLCDATGATTNCEPCKELAECLQFPLVFYSLNNNKNYANPLLTFQITCPNGSVVPVTIPAGTITYTLPFPPGFVGEYPPLVLACGDGYVVRYIPSGSTQEQIDDLVNAMILECAESLANAQAPCADPIYTNDAVYFVNECTEGEELTFSGTLPPWITLDVGESRLIGNAGTYAATTKAEANALAQAALNDFGTASLGNASLSCEPPGACGPAQTCLSVDLGVGFGDSNLVYHVGTTTLWAPTRNSTDLFVADATTQTLIQTIDLSLYGGGWDILVDTVNDQIVVISNNGDMLFIDPVTYAITPLLGVLHSNGVNNRPMAYDSTRGNILAIDVQRGFANDFFNLVSGASQSIIASNSHANSKGSPAYCVDTDVFYFSYESDPDLRQVNPTTLAVSATALTLAGPAEWIYQSRYVPETGQLWCQQRDGVDYEGVIIIDPVVMTVLGTVTGADIPSLWAMQEFCYQGCDGTMYISDLTQVVEVNTTTFAEIGLVDYPGASPIGMAFVQSQNAIWAVTDQFLQTPCPPI